MPRLLPHGLAAARNAAAEATRECLVYCVDRAVASHGLFTARVGRNSLERLFAFFGLTARPKARQTSQLAAEIAAALLSLCSGSAPLCVRVLCEQPHFVSAAPPSADWSSRPGSRNLMPGLRSRLTRGPWRGKGYTSSHAASGLETLAIAEAEASDIFVAIHSSFNSVSVTTESC